jgi:integrase
MEYKNKLYSDFKQGHFIEPISREDLDCILSCITKLCDEDEIVTRDSLTGNWIGGKTYEKMARSFMIILWASGARPAEVLNLTCGDVLRKPGNMISVFFKTLKHGVARELLFSYKDKFIAEFWDYCSGFTLPEMFIFRLLRCEYTRSNVIKTIVKENSETGEREEVKRTSYAGKNYKCTSAKVFHHFRRWVMEADIDILPYYLRHSRISSLADKPGATIKDLMNWKGAKSSESVDPYMHATKGRAAKVGEWALE